MRGKLKAPLASAVAAAVLGCALAGLFVLGWEPERRPLRFLAAFTAVAAPVSAAHAHFHARHSLSAAPAAPRKKRPGSRVAAALQHCGWTLAGAAGFALAAILFGAPLATVEPTALWALLLASLTVLPCSVVAGAHRGLAWLLAKSGPAPSRARWLVGTPAFCAALGAWLGAWVIPLDWDRPWQRWPVPCTYGAVAGALIGLTATAALAPLAPPPKAPSAPRPLRPKTN